MRFPIRLVALALAAAPFAAPSVAHAQIPDSMIPLRTVISELNTFRTEYTEYANAKNAKALGAMYDASAVVIRDDGHVLVGGAAIQADLEARAPNFPHFVIKSDTVSSYGATAIDVGTVTMHPAGGGELKNRYLVVLRRTMGKWKIVRVASTPETKAK
ncbi:MAG TPA: nuclear transport factor 2 family protein [Gemmatimonadales bacterium]|nr:nuclear transport factor 2 family protein [Gemmatimonadales bacterium]